ncbi:MAG: PAS domain-containing protein [Chitinophagaceae bacterium]
MTAAISIIDTKTTIFNLKNTMHNHVKHTSKWDTTKVVLLMVIVFLIILLCLSGWYGGFNSSPVNISKTHVAFRPATTNRIMAGSLLLIGALLFLWVREIRLRRKIAASPLLQKIQQAVPVNNVAQITGRFASTRAAAVTQKEQAAFSSGILDALSAHIAVINADGIIIKTNDPWNKFARNNGLTALEKCGEGANYFEACKNACNTDDGTAGKTMAGVKQVLDGSLKEFNLELPCHSPKEKRWFYMRVMRLESTDTLLVIEHHDITERKKAETASLKAIERYDILARATSDTIWDWDIINDRMLYNSGITKMFGYSVSEVNNVANWWKENMHPDDLPAVTDACYGAIDKRAETLRMEYRFLCANGRYKYIYDRAFVLYDDQQKAVRMIGAMQDITRAREEEKRMAKAIIDAQEQERHYIGQELHDNVNQLLASSLLTLGMVKHYDKDPAKVVEFAGLTKDHTLSALQEIRKLSHELTPATFEQSTLKDNFEALFCGINVDGKFNIDFRFDEYINNSVSNDVQINLYRILQEQVKNISTYSGADTIEIWVTRTSRMIRMRTFDNGRGFDTRKTKKGIGLSNMQRRVESFAGKFVLATQPGKGCEIIVEIPHE